MRPQLFFLVLIPLSAGAAMPEPLRDKKELVRPLPSAVKRIDRAKVLVADYELIKQDFPKVKNFTNEQINDWLLGNAGYLSEGQANQTNLRISDRVPESTAQEKTKPKALRPEGYGRALVYEVPGGLLDVKGAGTVSPQPGGHKSGLMSTGEGLREFLYEKKVQEIFNHSGLDQKTVGTYAVVDWGFDMVGKDGKSKIPAGAVVRQAHARPSGEELKAAKRVNVFLNDARAAVLERVLRTYGIVSSGESWSSGVSAINIQGTKNNAVFDFGAFNARTNFFEPAFRYEDADQIGPGNPAKNFKPLISVADMPSPDAALLVPAKDWGAFGSPAIGYHDAIADPGNRLVKEWREGRGSLEAIQDFVDAHLHGTKFPAAKAGWFTAIHPELTSCEVKFKKISKKAEAKK